MRRWRGPSRYRPYMARAEREAGAPQDELSPLQPARKIAPQRRRPQTIPPGNTWSAGDVLPDEEPGEFVPRLTPFLGSGAKLKEDHIGAGEGSASVVAHLS